MGEQKVGDYQEPEKKKDQIVKKVAAAKTGQPKKIITAGNAYVKATYNNTIITFTDQRGNVLGWSSAGQAGFRGPKKSTPYAAHAIVKKAIDKIRDYGLREVNVFVKGIGSGRESAIRAINANGINVLSIKDITPIPHNGCRPRRPRRV